MSCDDQSVFVGLGVLVDVLETAQRACRASVPAQKDLEILAEWFVIKPAAAGAQHAFALEPTQRLRDLAVALGAAQARSDAIHGTSWAERIDCIARFPANALEELGKGVVHPGHDAAVNRLGNAGGAA